MLYSKGQGKQIVNKFFYHFMQQGKLVILCNKEAGFPVA